jgi:hypothetical protein
VVPARYSPRGAVGGRLTPKPWPKMVARIAPRAAGRRQLSGTSTGPRAAAPTVRHRGSENTKYSMKGVLHDFA